MANRIRTGDPRGFNKGSSSKFRLEYKISNLVINNKKKTTDSRGAIY